MNEVRLSENPAGSVVLVSAKSDEVNSHAPRLAHFRSKRKASTMTPSSKCVSLVMQFEGCAKKLPDGRYIAYPDPGTGDVPWTIGWGSTGADIRKGTIWTQAQCDNRLKADVERFGRGVWNLLPGVPTSQAQFDAMCCMAYNVGLSALAGSTLLKKHKAKDYAGAADEFGKWVKAGGKTLPGLVRRRAAEAALYRSGM